MANVKTTEIDKGEKRIKSELALINNSFVTVGVHKGAGNYTVGKNPPSVAQVAFWNEFGTSTGIPARPAISSAVLINRESIQKVQIRVLKRLMEGSLTTRKALQAIGFKVETSIKNRINESNIWAEPNAPSTAAAKRRGGALRGPTPLIQSSLYFRSITNEVVIR